MHSLLARLAAVAMLVGGFAVTGDLGRLAERSAGVLAATTVPTERSRAVPPASPPAPPPRAGEVLLPKPVVPPRDAPIGQPVAPTRLPVSSLTSLDLGTLSPGDRLVVWIGTPPSPIDFDIIDPPTGEALERAPLQSGSRHHATPRRLLLEGDPSRPREIARGATLRVVPLGIASGGRSAVAETLGPVRAIEVR